MQLSKMIKEKQEAGLLPKELKSIRTCNAVCTPFSSVLNGLSTEEKNIVYEDLYYRNQEYKYLEKRLGLDLDNFYKMIDNIYFYDKLGRVVHIAFPSIEYRSIKFNLGKTKFKFDFKDLGIKFFLSYADCEAAAKQYLCSVETCMPISTFKKVCRLKEDDMIFCRNEDGRVFEDPIPRMHYYDKHRFGLVCFYEYDDDYGGGYEEVLIPLTEYGKTWALTKEELQ